MAPIAEDETTWLEQFRLLLQYPSPLAYDKNARAPANQLEYAVSGPGRIRQRTIAEFNRGGIPKSALASGGQILQKLENSGDQDYKPDETLVMGLWPLIHLIKSWHSPSTCMGGVLMHELCFEGILCEVFSKEHLVKLGLALGTRHQLLQMTPSVLERLYKSLKDSDSTIIKYSCGGDGHGMPPDWLFGDHPSIVTQREKWVERQRVSLPS